MQQDHTYYMSIALELAAQAAQMGEVPIGTVIVNPETGQVVATGSNSVIRSSNPCAHAEINAIAAACARAGNYRLSGLCLYTTLEPCAMCAGAIIQARLKHVYFGAREPKFGAVVSNANLFDKALHQFNHFPLWSEGILAPQSQQLLKHFFAERRSGVASY